MGYEEGRVYNTPPHVLWLCKIAHDSEGKVKWGWLTEWKTNKSKEKLHS